MRLSPDQLYDVLLVFREHLEPCWRQFHAEGWRSHPLCFGGGAPVILSTLTCQETSAFLYKQLEALGIDDVRLCGGLMRHAHPLDGDEFHENEMKDASDASRQSLDEEGYVWSPHFWLEHDGMVVDITKDQFGWEFSDIHDMEAAELIYLRRPGLFPESDLPMFASSVRMFEGGGILEDDSVRRSFKAAFEHAAHVIGAPALASG